MDDRDHPEAHARLLSAAERLDFGRQMSQRRQAMGMRRVPLGFGSCRADAAAAIELKATARGLFLVEHVLVVAPTRRVELFGDGRPYELEPEPSFNPAHGATRFHVVAEYPSAREFRLVLTPWECGIAGAAGAIGYIERTATTAGISANPFQRPPDVEPGRDRG